MGNRTTFETTLAGMSDSTSYTHDDGDRIATVDGVAYTYDGRGNLTSDGTWTYTYDGAGRMVRAEKPGSVYTYTYNGDGLLVAETTGGVETVFTWDLALAIPQVLATSDGAKNLYGLERIGVEQGGAWRYTLADALGSVRQWTGRRRARGAELRALRRAAWSGRDAAMGIHRRVAGRGGHGVSQGAVV